jgi:hypothetical protein
MSGEIWQKKCPTLNAMLVEIQSAKKSADQGLSKTGRTPLAQNYISHHDAFVNK